MRLPRPLGEPSSDCGPFEFSAWQFIVTEPFEARESVGDVVLAHAAVELLCPGDALRQPESRRERPEIGEVSSLCAVQDCEDLAGGQVLGGESWDATDLLQWEQGRRVDGEVDLDGLAIERCQESGEGDVVSDELNGPSSGGLPGSAATNASRSRVSRSTTPSATSADPPASAKPSESGRPKRMRAARSCVGVSRFTMPQRDRSGRPLYE